MKPIAPATDFSLIQEATSANPETLQAEISNLRSRYESGEQPTDKPERARTKAAKAAKTEIDEEEKKKRSEVFSGSLDLLARSGAALLCSALPNPQEPEELELEILASSLSEVSRKHFDRLLDYDAELSLTLALLAIVIPRLKKKKTDEPKTDEPKNMFEASEAAKNLAAEPKKPEEVKKEIPDAT